MQKIFDLYKNFFKSLPKNEAIKKYRACFRIWNPDGIFLTEVNDISLDLNDVSK